MRCEKEQCGSRAMTRAAAAALVLTGKSKNGRQAGKVDRLSKGRDIKDQVGPAARFESREVARHVAAADV